MPAWFGNGHRYLLVRKFACVTCRKRSQQQQQQFSHRRNTRMYRLVALMYVLYIVDIQGIVYLSLAVWSHC